MTHTEINQRAEQMNPKELAEHYLANLHNKKAKPFLTACIGVDIKIFTNTYKGVWLKYHFLNEPDQPEREVISLVGKPAPSLDKRLKKVLLHLPQDHREWWINVPFILRPDTMQYAQYHPLGTHFDLQPWSSPGRIDEYQAKPRERVKVTLRRWDTGEPVETPHDPNTKYPELPKPPKPRFQGRTKVAGLMVNHFLYFEYEMEKALCAAAAQHAGVYDVARFDEFKKNIRLSHGGDWMNYYHGSFMSNQGMSGSEIRRDDREYLSYSWGNFTAYEMTVAEIMSMMDEDVHPQILSLLQKPDTEGVVLYENQQMDSSRCGHRQMLPFGPGRMVKSLADAPIRLGDLPSTFCYPVYYARKGPEWPKPRYPLLKKESSEHQPTAHDAG
jgi:hypothetical protein